jgi:arylsulfate sulfotransferase
VLEVSLIPNPNEQVPLAGVLSLKSDKPVQVSLLINDGNTSTEALPDSSFSTSHTLPVLGLHPDTKYTVTATITDRDGNKTVVAPMDLSTPPLPEGFPPISLTASGDNLEPGITLMNLFRWKNPFSTDHWGLHVAVDSKGEVVWYYQADYEIGEARRLRNGNLFFGGAIDGRMYEIDMLGNIQREWHTSGEVVGEVPENSIPVGTDTFHHDVIEIASGNFIGLGLEVRSEEDFLLEYPPGTKRGPANLACDVLIEFTPEGEIVRQHNIADILGTDRITTGALEQGFYSELYQNRFDSVDMPRDVHHSNAIYYIEEEDAILVSSYIQCIIYKMDMKTGDIKWILGDPTGWKSPLSDKLLSPKGNVVWPYHQHGLEMTSAGTLLVYDNGGGRNILPNPPTALEEQYTRAVEYRIDEATGTVEEVWSYGPGQEQFVAPFIGDADEMPETKNILIADGGRFMDEEGNPAYTFGAHQWGRVLEVSRDKEPKKLWEVTVKDSKVRYSIYRAQKLKSLYSWQDRPTG